MSVQNISDWTKNMSSFPVFSNVYNEGENILTYRGGENHERIYFPVQVLSGIPVTFTLKFCSPSGYSCSYGSNVEYIAFVDSITYNSLSALSKTALNGSASEEYKEYSVSYTPTSDRTIYAVINFGYIVDGVTVTLKYKDIQISQKSSYWNISNGVLTNNSSPNISVLSPFPYGMPKALYRIENGILLHKLFPELSSNNDLCKALYRVENEELLHKLMPEKDMSREIQAFTISGDKPAETFNFGTSPTFFTFYDHKMSRNKVFEGGDISAE